MNTIIFDIDGTLVDSDAWDAELYIQSAQEVLGTVHIHDDWSAYEHVTDRGILQQIMREHDMEQEESLLREIEELFCGKTSTRIQQHPCEAILGAMDAIEKLVKSHTWQVGLATGGWERTAIAKLDSAGFDVHDLPLCTSSDYSSRIEIMKACQARMSQPAGRTVYVGDGAWDLKATRELNWGFIAIGKQLQGQHPVWIENFLDPAWKTAPEKALQAHASDF